jgi:hypothetical protein
MRRWATEARFPLLVPLKERLNSKQEQIGFQNGIVLLESWDSVHRCISTGSKFPDLSVNQRSERCGQCGVGDSCAVSKGDKVGAGLSNDSLLVRNQHNERSLFLHFAAMGS